MEVKSENVKNLPSHLLGVGGHLLLQQLLSVAESLLQLSVVGFLLAELVLQLLEILLVALREGALWTLLQTKQSSIIFQQMCSHTVTFLLDSMTHSCPSLPFELTDLLVERSHLGLGLQLEFGEASVELLLFALRVNKHSSVVAHQTNYPLC